jgi:hypothetical protein
VRGYPTYVVIDGHGTVSFNSGAEVDRAASGERLAKTARELKIAWPIDANVPKDIAIERFNQLLERMLSEEIEKARAANAQ